MVMVVVLVLVNRGSSKHLSLFLFSTSSHVQEDTSNSAAHSIRAGEDRQPPPPPSSSSSSSSPHHYVRYVVAGLFGGERRRSVSEN
ncbi:hypothetical protein M0802_009485 [Mischocyttarus mexicanus]|nr:hypothetical protein M0802_009485 [Mischocyttarus mexicanus]